MVAKYFLPVWVLGLVWIVSLGLGCSNDSTDSIDQIVVLDISPAVKPDHSELISHNLLTLTYSWKTGKTFKPTGDSIQAKVHFMDSAGKIIWQDDHVLPDPVKNWSPNQTYQYSRTCYIPLIPKQTDIRIMIGMFSVGNKTRYSLVPEKQSVSHPVNSSKIHVADLIVKPPIKPEDLPGAKIENLEGWFKRERDEKSMKRWQWMSRKATCRLRHPGRDARLMIRGWLPTSDIGEPSGLRFLLGETVLGEYQGVSNEFEYIFDVPQTMFGDSDSLILTLESDRDYRPAEMGQGTDNRDLGIMIKQLYFN